MIHPEVALRDPSAVRHRKTDPGKGPPGTGGPASLGQARREAWRRSGEKGGAARGQGLSAEESGARMFTNRRMKQ